MTEQTSETLTTWPYRSLLFSGTFGKSAPEGRRLHRRLHWAMAFFGAAVFTAGLVHRNNPSLVYANLAVMLASAGFAVRAFRIYFSELDELSRRIQYEAIAFSFVTMMFLGVTVGTWLWTNGISPDPMAIAIAAAFADVLRGIGLVRAARKYR